MRNTISMLRAACLPFVTRTFRGGRGRRYAALAIIMGLVAALAGTWFAQGTGSFERGMREVVDLETNRWQRQNEEYVLIAMSDWEYDMLVEQRRAALAGDFDGGGLLQAEMHGAAMTLRTATSVIPPRGYAGLAREASALLDAHHTQLLEPDPYATGFNWNSQADVRRLRSIVDRDLVPAVIRYDSPLGVRGTFQMIGLVSGGCIVVLLLIGAPLLAGVQIAQEVHENTLQPLTGTRLSARQLVLGMAAGPLALTGLLGIPTLLVFAISAVAAGGGLAALCFVVVTVTGSLLLVMLTSLIGLVSGRRRAPGIVGMGLATLLGLCLIAGTAMGMNMEDELVGTVTVFPQTGAVHLLREAFAPALRLDAEAARGIDLRLAVSVVAFLALAGIAGLALQRRVSGRSGPSLRRIEAFLGAGVLSWMALLTLPPEAARDPEAIYLISLGMLVVPAQFLLMGRIHLSEDPSTRRTIPLLSLLGEFFAYFGVHLAFALLVVGGPAALWPLSVAGGVHLLWGLSVAALVAVRAIAVPLKLPAMVWAGLCMGMIALEVGLGVLLCAMAHESYASRSIEMFPLFEASALLGMMHVILFVWTPISLVRALRKGSAGLR